MTRPGCKALVLRQADPPPACGGGAVTCGVSRPSPRFGLPSGAGVSAVARFTAFRWGEGSGSGTGSKGPGPICGGYRGGELGGPSGEFGILGRMRRGSVGPDGPGRTGSSCGAIAASSTGLTH